MRAVFADPKTDFVFKHIFGSEAHKSLLIALLELDAPHRIVDLEFLTPELHVPIEELIDLYDRGKMAEQDARGALSLSRREGLEAGRVLGREEGYAEGLRSSIRSLCQVLGIELDQQGEAKLVGLGTADLESLRDTLIADRRWPRSA